LINSSPKKQPPFTEAKLCYDDTQVKGRQITLSRMQERTRDPPQG
jgi:hypothetical protein